MPNPSTDLPIDETSDCQCKSDDASDASDPVATIGVDDEDTNIFRVLGTQARTRSIAQLSLAFVGGAVDAWLIWSRHPMLTWLAGGCAAVAAYGAWGLLDRAIEMQSTSEMDSAHDAPALESLRDLTAIAGTAAALWAVLSFMAIALGNWNH